MIRTAEWSLSRRTAPRYLLAGGGSNPSPVPIRSGHPPPREREGIVCARRGKLQNIGGEKPAFRGAVEVSVKAHDLKPVPYGGAVLVRVVEVQVELRRQSDEGVHLARRQRHHSDADSTHHVLQELAENLMLLLPK